METEVVIIGGGNVAGHLERWCAEKEISVRRVSSRTFIDGKGGPMPSAPLYIIAVTDDAIATVSARLKDMISPDALVVHTSGTRSCSELAEYFHHYGVLYPMQTFTTDKELLYDIIPLFIEVGSKDDMVQLEAFAKQLSTTVRRLDSERRKALHIAAVFACNYVNRLLYHAQEVLADCPFGLEILAPLITETVTKAIVLGPHDAQTGPARRGDTGVLNAHLDALESNSAARDLYSLLARQIQQDYGLRPQ